MRGPFKGLRLQNKDCFVVLVLVLVMKSLM